jgi:hypothetical protein
MTNELDRPKCRRPLRQYSLRTFLILVTLLCIWMAWFVKGVRQQRSAVEKIRELRGVVYYDYEVDAIGEQLEAPTPPGPAWVRNHLGVDYVAAVARVNLEGAGISDVEFLSGLTQLRALDLDRTKVRSLAPLSRMTKLKLLILDHTPVRDLRPLEPLAELQRLSARRTQIVDLAPLANLSNLEFLHLQDTAVRDVSALTALGKLQLLILDRTEVSDVSAFSGLSSLTWLSLDGTNVRELDPLLGLQNLERIDIKETSVSDAQVARFKKALPNCQVDRVRLSYDDLRESILNAADQ